MKIESIVIHTDINDKLQWLSDEEAGKLFKAIVAYAENGTILSPEDDRALGLVFLFVKDQIDRDYAKYLERRETNRENGRKGGRPKKTDGLSEKPTETDGLSEKPTESLPIPTPIIIPNTSPINNPIEDKGKTKRFAKPSPQEIKDYIEEKNLNVNPDQFYDYYESNGWMIGRNHMKDWKAAVRQWNAREPSYSMQSTAATQKAAITPQSVMPQGESSTYQEKNYSERF
jgi:hypothetical protein